MDIYKIFGIDREEQRRLRNETAEIFQELHDVREGIYGGMKCLRWNLQIMWVKM